MSDNYQKHNNQSIDGNIYTEGEFSVIRYVDRFRIYSNDNSTNLTYVFTADNEKSIYDKVVSKIKKMIEDKVDTKEQIELSNNKIIRNDGYVKVIEHNNNNVDNITSIYYVYVKRVGSRIMFKSYTDATEYADSITENCKIFDKMCKEDAEDENSEEDNQNGLSSYFGGGGVSSKYSKMF